MGAPEWIRAGHGSGPRQGLNVGKAKVVNKAKNAVPKNRSAKAEVIEEEMLK
jgi:hypothetical protein